METHALKQIQGATPAAMIALFIALSLMPGCIINGFNQIEGTDRGVFSSGGRATLHYREPTPRNAFDRIEIDLTHAAGDFSDRIDADDFFLIDDARFRGPAPLFADYRLSVGSLAFKGDVFRGGKSVSIDLLGGLGFSYMTLDLRSGNTAHEAEVWTLLPFLGTEISGRPLSRVTLYARGGAAFAFFTYLATLELGTEVALSRNVALAAGWRGLRYKADPALYNAALDLRIDDFCRIEVNGRQDEQSDEIEGIKDDPRPRNQPGQNGKDEMIHPRREFDPGERRTGQDDRNEDLLSGQLTLLSGMDGRTGGDQEIPPVRQKIPYGAEEKRKEIKPREVAELS